MHFSVFCTLGQRSFLVVYPLLPITDEPLLAIPGLVVPLSPKKGEKRVLFSETSALPLCRFVFDCMLFSWRVK